MTAADRVLEPLETIANRGHGRYDVFRDWVRLMLAALQRDDDRYLDILDDYHHGPGRDRGSRDADLFSQAFGRLQAAMAETNQDVLGEAFEEFGMQSERFGQHFTPHSVSNLLAEFYTASDSTTEPPVTIADPACGSGRLLIYSARRIDERTVVFGQDKDELCAQMAALNCCIFNLDGCVVYGDSLTLEKRRAWVTQHSPFGGSVEEVDPDDVPWPEQSFEDVEEDDPADAAPAERVEVQTADESSVDQADLTRWSA